MGVPNRSVTDVDDIQAPARTQSVAAGRKMCRRLRNLPLKGCDAQQLKKGGIGSSSKAIYRDVFVLPWNPNKFEFVQTLQEARINHGSVDLMRSLEQGCFVACKRMPNQWVMGGHEEFKRHHSQSPEEPWSDVCVAKYLYDRGFPYVCAQLGVFRDFASTYVLTSFATGGDLFSWMENSASLGSERDALMRPIVQDIFSAVRTLHEMGIAHRDLSPENMVLTDDGKGGLQLKLIDFGMASLERYCFRSRGKPSFQAPEMHLGHGYDAFLTDVFQLGVVVFALASKDYPWTSTYPGACKLFAYIEAYGLQAFLSQREVRFCNSQVLLEVLDPTLVELLEGILAFRPEERLSLGETCWVEEGCTRRSVMDSVWLAGGPDFDRRKHCNLARVLGA